MFKLCRTLAYSSFKVTSCVSIYAFSWLVAIPIGITSSAVGIKICTITGGIKRYTSIVKKWRRSMIK